jgi:hypothetical protein
VEVDMSTHAEFHKTHLSPGLAVILGFLLLVSNIVVHASTGVAVAQAENHAVQNEPANG